MTSNSNMDMAKHFEKFFWIFWGVLLAILTFYAFYLTTITGLSFLGPLIFMATMAGCVFRGFRALKREISALKSGEADVSADTQDSE